ncbi:MAG: hypothetical protein IJT94_13865 [Oscillibacter sp.]|nr:hypothetical protein [Oscillibacter sp.]
MAAKHVKEICALLLALLLLTGCGGHRRLDDTAETHGGEERTASDTRRDERALLWDIGETIHGFTLQSAENCRLLNGELYTFVHEYSGAELAYIHNSDPETAFSIACRTPLTDETGANHVFEHAILCGSEKYPSRDLGYDIANLSYNTFANAYTYPCATLYPVASRSEEQLLKLADAYMSCMVSPLALEDENFFRREAIRYELDDPEGEITLSGTVFSEDRETLTDLSENALSHVLKALYPGENASHMVSLSHLYWKDLTWDLVREAWERYYHFDNSLILLYGDLDCERFLEFLDRECLSRFPRSGTDLSPWRDGDTEPGYVETEGAVPAYSGDDSGSCISYAVSLAGASLEDLLAWEIAADILNENASVLGDLLWERNLSGSMWVWADWTIPKPCLCFQMSGADPAEKDAVRRLAEDTLRDLARHGLRRELLDAALWSAETDALLLPDTYNAGVEAMENICQAWAIFGRTDFYPCYEKVLRNLAWDGGRDTIRALAKSALKPGRSALVVSTPAPGLAEQYEADLAAELRAMKDSLSPSAREALAAETAAFRAWNEQTVINHAFFIDPASLPEQTVPAYRTFTQDGVSVWEGTADVTGIGSYRLDFDLSGLDREDLQDLMLYMSLTLLLDTERYAGEELDALAAELLRDFQYSLLYAPAADGVEDGGTDGGTGGVPLLDISWKGRREDFSRSLDLLLSVLTETDVDDTEGVSWYLWQNAGDWNRAWQEGYDAAWDTALAAGGGAASGTMRLRLDADGQDNYYRAWELSDRLDAHPSYGQTCARRFREVRERAFTCRNLTFSSVTGPGEAVTDDALCLLAGLPDDTAYPDSGMADSLPAYTFPNPPAKRTALCVEASMQDTILAGNLPADLPGEYLPWVYALSHRYLLPRLRYQLGTYSAGAYCDLNTGTLTAYSGTDPHARQTAEALYSMADALETLDIPAEEWNGYLLAAFGDLTFSQGVMEDVMTVMRQAMLGTDPSRQTNLINHARDGKLSDQTAAAACLKPVIEGAALCTAGSEAVLRADADTYDDLVLFP